MPRTFVLVTAALVLACGGSLKPGGVDGGSGDGGVDGGSGDGGVDGGSGDGGRSCAVAGKTPTRGAGSACLGSDLLTALGKDHVLVGMSGSDTAAKAAPYDVRYQYIVSATSPGAATCTSCTIAGCSNWWGCGWQESDAAPGLFIPRFIGTAKDGGEIPMITYYQILPTINWNEGQAEVTSLPDAAVTTPYLEDWRFLLQKIGDETALLHIEPDFWGYAQQYAVQHNVDCSGIPAAVNTANPTDCPAASFPNTLAGLGKCMIAMVHKYAKNAKVGLHASGWATNYDVLNNTSASFDVQGEATKLGNFLKGCGADQGDFVVADMSDRDAAYYQIVKNDPGRWWDATNAKLPDFHQAFQWAGTMATTIGKPILWWQVPVGNMCLDNSNQHYQDNRVEYVFDHWDELAASHAVGVVFGGGNTDVTSADTDNGVLAAKTNAYITAGGEGLCQ